MAGLAARVPFIKLVGHTREVFSEYRGSVGEGSAAALAPLEYVWSLGARRRLSRLLSYTISGSGESHPPLEDSRTSSEEDLNFSTMIMDGIDPMSAAAMAESSAISFSLVSFDTFDKGGDCLGSASVFDRPVEDLNTPVTTSEINTFFTDTEEPMEEPDPPPITGKVLPYPPRPPRPLSPTVVVVPCDDPPRA